MSDGTTTRFRFRFYRLALTNMAFLFIDPKMSKFVFYLRHRDTKVSDAQTRKQNNGCKRIN